MKPITTAILTLSLAVAAIALTQAPSPSTAEAAGERSDKMYHYSIWGAFVNRVFEGFLPVSQLKQEGDIGLGSFTRLDGEMIMLDGVVYNIDENGKVFVAEDDENLVYANAAFHDAEKTFEIPAIDDYESLRQLVGNELDSRNYFYAFKITGHFDKMKCGGLARQEPPFETGLDVLIPNRPIFERENFSGTMVGFFCPKFIGDINVAGFHLHFISDDRTFGGHVIEFSAQDLTVEIDRMSEYQFVLPESSDFEGVEFDKEFQYRQQ